MWHIMLFDIPQLEQIWVCCINSMSLSHSFKPWLALVSMAADGDARSGHNAGVRQTQLGKVSQCWVVVVGLSSELCSESVTPVLSVSSRCNSDRLYSRSNFQKTMYY